MRVPSTGIEAVAAHAQPLWEMNISICRAMSIKETEQLCAPITRIGDYPGWGYVMVDYLMILLLHNIIASALLEDLVSLTCLLLL